MKRIWSNIKLNLDVDSSKVLSTIITAGISFAWIKYGREIPFFKTYFDVFAPLMNSVGVIVAMAIVWGFNVLRKHFKDRNLVYWLVDIQLKFSGNHSCPDVQ